MGILDQQPPSDNNEISRDINIVNHINKILGNPLANLSGARSFQHFDDKTVSVNLMVALTENSEHAEELEAIPADLQHPVFALTIDRPGNRSYITPFGVLTDRSIINGKLYAVNAVYFFTPAGDTKRVLEIYPLNTTDMSDEDFWVKEAGHSIEELGLLAHIEADISQIEYLSRLDENEYLLIESLLSRIENGDLPSTRHENLE